MRIENEYVKNGYFWLPNNETQKIPGLLTINNGGNIELEVVGHFQRSDGTSVARGNIGRIIGHVEHDGLVTLDDCFYTKWNYSSGGISKSKVCVNLVLSGAAYEIDEPTTFNTLAFSVDCLDDWLQITGIEIKNDMAKRSAIVSYNPPDKITHSLDDDVQLEIGFSYSLPGEGNMTEAKITQEAFFKLRTEQNKPLCELINLAKKIVDFMCFAMDTTVSLKKLVATTPDIQRKFGQNHEIPIPIRIYYESIPFTKIIPSKKPHQMLFNYESIKTNGDKIFNTWLNAYETFSPALDLYFSTKNGDHRLLNSKFLALAQGLETFHRRTCDEKLMKTDEFDILVKNIIGKCIDESLEDHAKWLTGRLIFGNELTLTNRIKLIFEPFKAHLGSNKQRKKTLRRIVDTRNYFTHYNEDLKEKSANQDELIKLCNIMEAVFQLHFLRYIGLNDEQIHKTIENCSALKNKLKPASTQT